MSRLNVYKKRHMGHCCRFSQHHQHSAGPVGRVILTLGVWFVLVLTLTTRSDRKGSKAG